MMRQLYPVDHQNPLGTTRTLLGMLWEIADFEGMYLPTWDDSDSTPEGRLLQQPHQLERADPFAPVMTANHAPSVLQILQEDPQRRIGVFLRPCEWRSFYVLINGSGDLLQNLFKISADCTGVLAVDNFIRLAKGDPLQMTRQVLHFASQGGILPSRHQASCQMCENPFPNDVDLHFELFGVPTEEQLILDFSNPETAQALSNKTLASEVPSIVADRREQVLQDLARWRASSFEKIKVQLGPDLLSLQGLADHIRSCESCQITLTTQCPLIDLEMLLDPSDPELQQFLIWLQSCSGCGVCDQTCPEEYPLFGVIFSLRGIQ